MFNVYWELPGVGGGNEQHGTLATARKAFESIVKHLPDAYVEVTTVAPDGEEIGIEVHGTLMRAPDGVSLMVRHDMHAD